MKRKPMKDIQPIAKRRDLGLPPGTPIFIGEQRVEKVHISYMQYNSETINEGEVRKIEKDYPNISADSVTWINVIGVHEVSVIKKIGEMMSIDPLITEDIVDTSSRPRIEDMEDYFYLILKDLVWEPSKLELQQEQFSFIIGENYLITFQEDIGDLFDLTRERLRTNKGKLRKSKADFLLNRLLDTIVDNYYLVVEEIGSNIENLENSVISNPSKDTLQTIQSLKSELIYLRRLILPVREMVGIMRQLNKIVISDATNVYVRSIYDHLNQVIDTVEIYREILTGFLEIYLSSISNKTNDVMKVLTIITSVFIPLSFLAGVYGMNFEHMPELSRSWTYPALWVVFITIASGMMYYFKKLGWLKLE